MSDRPLAYFITFTTYGTWLHGNPPGSVDREHNQFGTPVLPPDATRHAETREQLRQAPYVLDPKRRMVVRDAIVEECRFRGWTLRALHVRSNHVHLVVTAERTPEFVMRSCKAHASQCLTKAGLENRERKRWTAHGSTIYLWNEANVADKVDYTLNRQGEPMARFPDGTSDVNSAPQLPSEPERQRGE